MRRFADDAVAAAGWSLARAPRTWIVGLNLFWIAATEIAAFTSPMMAVAAGTITGCVASNARWKIPKAIWLLPLGGAALAGSTWLLLAGGWVLATLLAQQRGRPGFVPAMAILAAAVLVEPGIAAARVDANCVAGMLLALGILQLSRNGHGARNGTALAVAYAAWLYAASWGNSYVYVQLFTDTVTIPPLLFAVGRVAEGARVRTEDGGACADRAASWMTQHPWRTTALVLVATIFLRKAADAEPWGYPFYSWHLVVLPAIGLVGLALLFHVSREARTLLGKASVYCAVAVTLAYSLVAGPPPHWRFADPWLTPWLPVVTGWIAGRRPPLRRLGATEWLLAAAFACVAAVTRIERSWRHSEDIELAGTVVALLLFHRAVAVATPTARLVGLGAALGAAGSLAGGFPYTPIASHMCAQTVFGAAHGAVIALTVAIARRVRSMTLLPDDHPALDARPAAGG